MSQRNQEQQGYEISEHGGYTADGRQIVKSPNDQRTPAEEQSTQKKQEGDKS